MKIEREYPTGAITLEELAEKHDLTLRLRRNVTPDGVLSYMADFKDCNGVRDGVFAVGTVGRGFTEEQAIRDYAKRISFQRITFGCPTKEDRLDLELGEVT